jgi:hypothetical protein
MPAQPDLDQLRSIKTFPSLVKYLRDELDWPIDPDNVDDLTFEYTPEELGFDPKHAVKIREIKQLRPLVTGQPWGIFWVSFEKKKLPMVVLRRILGKLITKSRATADKASRPTWHLHDLLFISSYGEEEHRNISFAHFSESVDSQLPVLRVLGWDDQNSIMNLDRVANRLRSCLRWPGNSGDLAMWRDRWSGAFTERYGEPVESAEALIERLAEVASSIRKRALDVLEAETDRGPMRKLFTAVRGLLIHDMSEDQFADMYAQTVSYGLLSASFSRPAGINPENLVQLTKITNPFLESLLESLFRLNRGKFHFDVDEVGINDVLDLLRATNIEAIKAAFNDLNPAEDPVVRFYEGFLKAYDSEQRIKRGVFFTPRPVVSYVIRSVHELLQSEFGLEDGLASTATWANVAAQMERRRVLAQQEGGAVGPAFEIPKGVSPNDPFVLILDVATGTATFLNECIEVIERTMKTKWARELGKPDHESPSAWRDTEILARWRDYVPNHLLPRLYGFEIMMAPYAIAHVKLALKLGETGYQFRDGDRLRIYLTNTLEPPSDIADTRLADLFGPLAREAQEVNLAKRTKRFTIVIGNPPYSVSSWNTGSWITSLVEDYKRTVRGEESQIQSLSNDYIKFLRYGQWQIEQASAGVLGMITGHGYLHGTQPRDLRGDLSETFDRCYCLDLHGSIRRTDTADGQDEPVFLITTGVAIIVAFRAHKRQPGGTACLSSLTGPVLTKFAFLGTQTACRTHPGSTIYRPCAPNFYFAPSETAKEVSEEYYACMDLPDIFGTGNRQADKEIFWATGLASQQDDLAVSFSRAAVGEKMAALAASRSFKELQQDYRLCTTDQWHYADAREFAGGEGWRQYVGQVAYRPFDRRWTVLHKHVLTILRRQVMSQLTGGDERNLGLVSSRAVNDLVFAHCFVATEPVDKIFISSKTSTNAYVFPLFFKSADLYGSERRANFSPKFLAALAEALGLAAQEQHSIPIGLTPEDIFHYFYAVLHSPQYRRRYAEFLKIDFPRLPLTRSLELFRELACLGGELVALHLLESPRLEKPMTEYVGGRSPEVERVSWSGNAVWIDTGRTTGFRGVAEGVWNFHIGGYQVCEKWLKDRKGRTLSADDRTHYQRIVVALHETTHLMADIDRVIEKHGGWPLK